MFGLSLFLGTPRAVLRPVLFGVYLFSVMGVVIGLNAGIRADSPAAAEINVEEHVTEIDAKEVQKPEYSPIARQLVPLAERAEQIHILPDPYHSRLDAWIETRVTEMVKYGLRLSLSIADVTASLAYAHQSTLSTPVVSIAVKAAGYVAIFGPIAGYNWLLFRGARHAR